MSLLHDKVVLVSGGTQGVGAGIVRASASGTAAFIQADLADPRQAINSVRQTVDRFGRIDCLVNSAGLTTRSSLLDTSVELSSNSTWRSTCQRRSSRCRPPSWTW